MNPEVDMITRIKEVEIKIGDKFQLTLQRIDGTFRVLMRDYVMVNKKTVETVTSFLS